MALFPYTNGHELNLDWILKVIKDFQDQYQNIDADLQHALDEITAAANSGLQSINSATESGLDTLTDKLQTVIRIIDGKIADAEIAINHTVDEANETINETVQTGNETLTNAAQTGVTSINDQVGIGLQALEDDEGRARARLAAFSNEQFIAISNLSASSLESLQNACQLYLNEITNKFQDLYVSLPNDSEQILGQLTVMNDIFNGAHPGSFQWLQGCYLNDDLAVTSDNTWVSTLIFQRAAGRRVKVHCANGYGVGRIGCWYLMAGNYVQGGYYPSAPETEVDYVIPNNTVYTSIQIRKTDLSNLTPADMIPANVTIDFPVPALEMPPVVAQIEESFMASKRYLENELFSYEQRLYQALVPIEKDTAFSAVYGGNVQQKKLGNLIFENKWVNNIQQSLTNNGEYTFSASDMVSGQWSYSRPAENPARGRIAALLPVRAGMKITYIINSYDLYIGVLEAQNSTTYRQTVVWANTSDSITINYDGYMTLIFRDHSNPTLDIDPAAFDSSVTIETTIKQRLDGLTPNP